MKESDRCVPLLALVVEMYEKEEERGGRGGGRGHGGGGGGLEEAAALCEVLGGEVDRTRAKYWLGSVLARINGKLVKGIKG